MKVKEIIKLIERDGWYLAVTRGSHRQFKHGVKPGRVTMTNDYLVIVSYTGRNWAAHAPDVPGCVATGKTEQECLSLFQEALDLHFQGLREDGLDIPKPSTHVHTVRIAA